MVQEKKCSPLPPRCPLSPCSGGDKNLAQVRPLTSRVLHGVARVSGPEGQGGGEGSLEQRRV